MTPSHKDDCPFKDVVFPEKVTEHDSRMDTRVGRLEGVVESLTRDIQEVSQNISMMGKEIGQFREMIGDTLTRMRDSFNDQINTVTDRLTASTKPQWQTISAFAALAITLLGMAGAVVGLMLSGQSDNIADLKRENTVITERMFNNQYEKGKSDAFAAEVAGHLDKLDHSLQREMALITATTEAKISGLDEKLQMELRLHCKNTAEDIARITDDISEIRKWRLEHAEKGSATDAEIKAKQDMLIKLLDDLESRMQHETDIKK
jgi:chromosome segregation ATPase